MYPPVPAPPVRSSNPLTLILGLGAAVAALITFVSSFLPWYAAKVSVSGYGSQSDSVNAWHRFWWVGIILAIIGGILVAAGLLAPAVARVLAISGAVVSGIALVTTVGALIDILNHNNDFDGGSFPGVDYSAGPSFGVFLALVGTAAAAGCAVAAAIMTPRSAPTPGQYYPPQYPGQHYPPNPGYGYQQPGGYPQPGGYQQPGGYPPPGGYEQPGGYQQPGKGDYPY